MEGIQIPEGDDFRVRVFLFRRPEIFEIRGVGFPFISVDSWLETWPKRTKCNFCLSVLRMKGGDIGLAFTDRGNKILCEDCSRRIMRRLEERDGDPVVFRNRPYPVWGLEEIQAALERALMSVLFDDKEQASLAWDLLQDELKLG